MAHARLGPSNHRWPHCSGSIREESEYVDVAGEAAIDGTGSHELLELCLNNNVNALTYDGQIIGANHHDKPNGWLVNLDRIERVQMCLDYIKRRHAELSREYPNADIIIEAESRSDPGSVVARDDWWGTVDITIRVVEQSIDRRLLYLEIVDYKDGRGYVDEKYNSQLISYAVGKAKSEISYVVVSGQIVKWDTSKLKTVRMTIVQPKTTVVVRYQEMTLDELCVEGTKLSKAARLTDDPNAPLVAGKHCQWCKANQKRGGHCDIEQREKIETVKTMGTDVIATDGSLFEMIDQVIADPDSLSSDQLAKLLDAQPAINAMFEKASNTIQKRVEAGEKVSGYGMRPGNSSSVWNDEEEMIVKKLRSRKLTLDDIYPKKLVSVAQVLKNSKLTKQQKERIQKELVAVKAGKLKLTKIARDIESTTVEEMFGDVVAQPSSDVVQSISFLGDDTPTDEISFL